MKRGLNDARLDESPSLAAFAAGLAVLPLANDPGARFSYDGVNTEVLSRVIEVVAGLLVAFRPRIGALVVFAWLLGIIVNLLIAGQYLDIALRDFGLALGAFALHRLSLDFDGEETARA